MEKLNAENNLEVAKMMLQEIIEAEERQNEVGSYFKSD
jgi:hypothetical protein